MAKATLPTNFKDDILASSMGSKRRYNVINNSDGTISLEDVTDYTQVGSIFGAAQINATNAAANAAADASKIIDDYDTLMANTQAGYMAGALAVKKLNSNLSGKLLWTNPSPTSAFSGQTISVDLSNYKYFYVDYKFSTAETVTKRFYFKVDEVTNSSYQLIPSMFNTARTGTVYRVLGRNSSGLIFNACLYCGTTSGATYNYSIDNTGMIPIAIYGCNSVVNLSV